jgi:TRAP-type mannitol/chloroaromatic compound transport system permease large subunit
MDAFVLLFTLAILLALGMPVAFAVGLSAVAGALWIDLPLEALMIQITSGVNKFTLLAIPFLFWRGRSWRRVASRGGWSILPICLSGSFAAGCLW